MQIVRRKIDVGTDRDYCLECHCRVNYACDTPWKRAMTYEAYRAEWFSYTSQVHAFIEALQASMENPNTLAEILETQDDEFFDFSVDLKDMEKI